MFPEYRELITRLKTTDHHFTRLFDKHNELDQKIKNMESHIESGTHEEIETLKKKHGNTVIAFVEDPDGYKIELIQHKGRSD